MSRDDGIFAGEPESGDQRSRLFLSDGIDATEQLFADAIARPEEERATFIEDACQGDPVLRDRVLMLLAAHESPANRLTPGTSGQLPLAPEEKAGDAIGRYTLVEKIGQGGCGVVWLAEQQKPVRRRVALKVIKLGMDTKAVVARFEAERQALAMMDHPNIAKVYDAGATDTGRPFFVMELVRGIPITRYCDDNHVSPTARLELFVKVCQAVQHAHQKGIIHRDLKPSNILVAVNDAIATPVVIDFGIAKAIPDRRDKVTEATMLTAFDQFIGTPAYMSPEQADVSSLDVDTRSDIYSLGVMLYELLTGRLPFDPNAFGPGGVDGLRHQIRAVEPPRPSARLRELTSDERSTIARSRNTIPAELALILRGDLDWIVMRCIEKDRTRRYDTAEGLALDLQRHLRNEPVLARPPSTVYLLRKLIRRHRVGVAASSTIAVVVMVGAIVSAWQAVRATRAEKQQSSLREIAEQAQAAEVARRREAQSHERAARRLLYAADMNLAQQALNNNNIGRVRRLLDRHRPAGSAEDLRGWEWRYLWQQSRSDALAQLNKRDARAFTVSFSPDGRLLVVAYMGGRIELWEVESRRLVRVLQEDSEVRAGNAIFSPRDNAIVSSGESGVLMWHDLSNGRTESLGHLGESIRNLSFSRDGDRVVAVTWGRRSAVHIVDVERKTILKRLPITVHGAAHFDSARLSADHERLYYNDRVDNRSLVRMRRVSTGEVVWEADSGPDVAFSAMELTPDERFLVTSTGYQDSRITVRHALTGEIVTELKGHTRWVPWLAFSRDGRLLASTSSDQTIRLWDTTTWTPAGVFRGHGDEVESVAFSPDGRLLASGCKDGAVLLWRTDDAKRTTGQIALPKRVQLAWPLAGGPSVVALNTDSTWSIIDLRTKHEVPLPFDPGHATFLLPPNIFGVHDRNDRLTLHEVHSGGLTPIGEISVGRRYIGPFAYHHNEKLVAWGDGSKTLHVTSLSDPTVSRPLGPSKWTAVPVSFTPDGLFLRGREGNDSVIWNVSTGQRVTLPAPESIYSDIRRPHTAAQNRPILADAFLQYRPAGGVSAQALSPDGATLAISAQSGQVAVYDFANPKNYTVLHGHMGAVHGVAFSPDGKRMVTTGGGDETAKLWDVETRQELLTLGGGGSLVSVVMFSPDGDTLVVGSRSLESLPQYWIAPSWAEIERAEKAETPPASTP